MREQGKCSRWPESMFIIARIRTDSFNNGFLGIWVGDSIADLNIGSKIEITKKEGVIAVLFTEEHYVAKKISPNYKDGRLVFEQGGKLTLSSVMGH